MCVYVAAHTVPAKAEPVAGVQILVSFHSSALSAFACSLKTALYHIGKYNIMGEGCDLLSMVPTCYQANLLQV